MKHYIFLSQLALTTAFGKQANFFQKVLSISDNIIMVSHSIIKRTTITQDKEISKEDAVAREDARCWVYREPLGAPGEATPIGVGRNAML